MYLALVAGDALDSIAFVTSLGRISPRYGGSGGSACPDLVAPPGKQILSLRMHRIDPAGGRDWLSPRSLPGAFETQLEADLADLPSPNQIADMEGYHCHHKLLHALPPPGTPIRSVGPCVEFNSDEEESYSGSDSGHHFVDYLAEGLFDDDDDDDDYTGDDEYADFAM